MSLKEYIQKRDFSASPEPKGTKPKKSKHRFTVQKHAASRLHYDLRIEHNGVLLSWAVPKGISADPSVKRLAVQTEDHPVKYLDFEGNIPKGQYGAGEMIVWDTATYSQPPDKPEQDLSDMLEKQYKAGRIHLFFDGKKMKGEYSLVRTSKEKRHWLLIKVRDNFASEKKTFDETSVLSGKTIEDLKKNGSVKKSATKKPVSKPKVSKGSKADFPAPFSPMLAKLSKTPFSDPDWVFEAKYDGYRCLVFKEKDQVKLYSRNGNLLNEKFKDLVEAAATIPGDFVADSEIIVTDKSGGGDFQKLQQYVKKGVKGTLRLVLFDLIFFEGKDLSKLPLNDRKEVLKALLSDVKDPHIKYSKHIAEQGEKFLAASNDLGLEGIIAKKKDSRYVKNSRSSHWLKLKNIKEEDLVVVGVTPSTAAGRSFGAVLLARPVDGDFEYAGKVGSGFGDQQTDELLETFSGHKTKSPPVKNVKEKVLFWLKPKLYAEIKYSEKTEEGKLRHPVFLRLRSEKFYSPTDHLPKTKTPTVSNVKISNPDKVFFPEQNIRKKDIINYYETVADVMLPHLKDRPLTLKRNPNGIKDKGFYQKDVSQDVPGYVQTIALISESSDKDEINYAMCNNKSTLLFLANWGCVEMHAWNSRKDQLDYPDHLVLDLDPQDNTFDEIKQATKVLIDMLDDWEIPYGIKTSGGDGLHLYVPLQPKYTHRQVRTAAHIIGKLWLEQLPDLGSLERMPKKRVKKIYLDYLQNGRGKTMATPYSLRVKKGAPVSTPVSWSQFQDLSSLQELNIHTVPEMLEETAAQWKDLYRRRIKLETLVTKIENAG